MAAITSVSSQTLFEVEAAVVGHDLTDNALIEVTAALPGICTLRLEDVGTGVTRYAGVAAILQGESRGQTH